MTHWISMPWKLMAKMMEIYGNHGHVEPRHPGAIGSGRKSVFHIARVQILVHPDLDRSIGAHLGGNKYLSKGYPSSCTNGCVYQWKVAGNHGSATKDFHVVPWASWPFLASSNSGNIRIEQSMAILTPKFSSLLAKARPRHTTMANHRPALSPNLYII